MTPSNPLQFDQQARLLADGAARMSQLDAQIGKTRAPKRVVRLGARTVRGEFPLDRYSENARRMNPRELQLMTLFLEEGLTNQELADRMHITAGTVKVYKCRAMQTLGWAAKSSFAVLVAYWRWRISEATGEIDLGNS